MSQPSPSLAVLVVEDEALLAMDMEALVEECGHAVVGEAACLYEVERLPADLDPDLAFVDMQLARGTNGIDVARLIRTRWRNTLIVFVTANLGMIPPDYAGADGAISKPFSRNGIVSAMHYLENGILHPPPTLPHPASFIVAPALAARWS